MNCSLCGYVIEGMGFICPKCHPSPVNKELAVIENFIAWLEIQHNQPPELDHTQKGAWYILDVLQSFMKTYGVEIK